MLHTYTHFDRFIFISSLFSSKKSNKKERKEEKRKKKERKKEKKEKKRKKGKNRKKKEKNFALLPGRLIPWPGFYFVHKIKICAISKSFQKVWK